MMGMVRTQVQLSDEQLQVLRKLSASTGRSIAGLIRDSVDHYVNSQKGVSRQHQIERALRAAGRFSSGSADGSAQHDRHLAEAFRK
jgi:predicted DNA-binding protein